MSTALVLPTVLQSVAIAEFQAAGGVVDYAVFNVVGEGSREDLHWQAGLDGMHVLTVTAFAKSPPPPVPISDREFVGPFFDFVTQQLIDPWEHSAGGGSSRGSHGEYITAAYADAFLDPPYKLRVPIARASALFNEINTDVFGGFHPDLDIRKWSTDWSDYFAPGKEWWGAFFWTLYSPRFARVSVIAASSTD